jgi:hypothetical protein
MLYASVADVQARMPQFVLTPTSKPSVDDVPALIEDAEQEFSATMTTFGYALPIDATASPMAFQIAKAMCCYAAIWRILEARAAAVGGDPKSAERAKKYYDDRIAALLDTKNPFTLADCPRTGKELAKAGSVLLSIETPDPREGENWPLSRPASISQVF